MSAVLYFQKKTQQQKFNTIKKKPFVERKLLSLGIYYNAPKIKSKQEGTLFALERKLLTPKQEVKLIKVNENRAN